MAPPIDRISSSSRSTNRRIVKTQPSGDTPAPVADVSESETGSFQEVLASVAGSASQKRLEYILNEIKHLGSILVKRRLLEDLEQYRNKVGEFLKTFLDEALDLRQVTGRQGVSRRKQMLVIKKVDIELEELSRLVMGAAPDFKIMKELNIIEGLLMDLYH